MFFLLELQPIYLQADPEPRLLDSILLAALKSAVLLALHCLADI
jgi:hypothetical protein